jgi:probable blue pigment (indigoidine) exporter
VKPVPGRTTPVSVALLATSVLFWGGAFRSTAIAVHEAPPFTVAALRAAPAGLVLIAILPLLGSPLPRGRIWIWAAASGILMVATATASATEGVVLAGSANTAVLGFTTPFFVLVLGRLFLRELVSWWSVMGLVIGFAGIVGMVSTQLGGHDTGALMLGMSLALTSAASWAVGILIVKWLVEHDPALDLVGLTGAQHVVGGAALLVLAFSFNRGAHTDWSSIDLWGSVAWLALGSSAIGIVAFFGALKRLSATRASAWLFLVPVVAVLVEMMRGHGPAPVALVGMALAVSGVTLVSVAPDRVARFEPGEAAVADAAAREVA